jgi:AmiR/NasT family two-component response regulator
MRPWRAPLIFAAHTTLAWNAMRRQEQFQSALASRDVIGQATGMLMERFDIDAVAAFELLRRLSQESNTKFVTVAGRIVRAERPDQGTAKRRDR